MKKTLFIFAAAVIILAGAAALVLAAALDNDPTVPAATNGPATSTFFRGQMPFGAHGQGTWTPGTGMRGGYGKFQQGRPSKFRSGSPEANCRMSRGFSGRGRLSAWNVFASVVTILVLAFGVIFLVKRCKKGCKFCKPEKQGQNKPDEKS